VLGCELTEGAADGGGHSIEKYIRPKIEANLGAEAKIYGSVLKRLVMMGGQSRSII
jgi:hypothetical protein